MHAFQRPFYKHYATSCQITCKQARDYRQTKWRCCVGACCSNALPDLAPAARGAAHGAEHEPAHKLHGRREFQACQYVTFCLCTDAMSVWVRLTVGPTETRAEASSSLIEHAADAAVASQRPPICQSVHPLPTHLSTWAMHRSCRQTRSWQHHSNERNAAYTRTLQSTREKRQLRYDTIRYDILFALKNWQASCQFNLANELKEN